MLQLFRNNSPFTVIILFIFALLVKMQALVLAQPPVIAPGHVIFSYIVKGMDVVMFHNKFGYTMLTVVMLFLQALYLKQISEKHRLFPKPSYLPAFVYILLTSIYPPLNFFSDTLLMNWLVLGAIDIMLGFSQAVQPRKLIFNAGFLLCCAALFQFSALVYFLLLITGLLLLRSFSIGELTVGLLGYFTPLYFFIATLFLIDKFYVLHLWPHIGFSMSGGSSPLYLIVTLAGLLILFLAGLYATTQNVQMSNIYIRRSWITLAFYFGTSVFIALATDSKQHSAWLMVMPAMSIAIAQGLSFEKSRQFSNFIFYFSLVYILFCQLAYK